MLYTMFTVSMMATSGIIYVMTVLLVGHKSCQVSIKATCTIMHIDYNYSLAFALYQFFR